MADADTGQEAQHPTPQELSAQFHERYDAIEREIDEAKAAQKEAVESRKNLRKIIKAAQINLVGFDQARADRDKSGELREEEQAEYHRQMAWMGKPVKAGEQAKFEFEAEQPQPAEIQIRRVRDAGRVTGKNGADRNANPWTPGTLLWSEFDGAWREGHQEWETAQEANAQTVVPKRGPGRPRKNTVAPEPAPEASAAGEEPAPETPAPPPAPKPSRAKRGGISFDSETEGSA